MTRRSTRICRLRMAAADAEMDAEESRRGSRGEQWRPRRR